MRKHFLFLRRAVLAAALFLCAAGAWARVVISQFSFGSDYSHKDEYVELYNNSSDEIVDISLWKLQFRATRAMPWRTIAVVPEDTFLPPKYYYLIGSKEYTSDSVAADLVGNFGMGLSTEGSIRITDFYGGPTDLVGYGPSSPEFEKKPIVRVLGQVVVRNDPRVDTDDNQKDFGSTAARSPKNLSGAAAVSLTPRAALEDRSKRAEAKEVISDEKYNRSEAIMAEARALWRQEKWLSALEKNKLAEQFTPESTEVRHFKEKMVREVKNRLERQSLVGQDEYYGRAFLFYAADDYQNMQNALRKILVFNPRHAEAREFYEKMRALAAPARPEAAAPPPSSVPVAGSGGEITIMLDASPTPPKKRAAPSAESRRPPGPAPKTSVESSGFSSDKADELYDRGLREFAEGRLSEAIRYWEQTLRIDPGHFRAQKALTRAKKRIQSGQ